MTLLTSRNGAVMIGPGAPVALINDKPNALDLSPEELSALRAGDLAPMLERASWGLPAGTALVDVLAHHPELDEVALLPRLAVAIHEAIGCPIVLDSRNVEALEAALAALRPYKTLLNSVTAERASMDALLPLAARYGAAIVGMPIGDAHGMSRDVVGRVAEARTLIETAARYGIPREDIIMDAICLASAAEPGSMQVTLETLKAFHEELGVATTLGIGNAGHGMPEQTHIDLAFLLAAIPWGLDSALVDPRTPLLPELTRAMDFLTARDPYGKGYLQQYRVKRKREQRGR